MAVAEKAENLYVNYCPYQLDYRCLPPSAVAVMSGGYLAPNTQRNNYYEVISVPKDL